ncbi:MAG: ribose 5-phosphate isomerase B [Desulfovibrio sp.]|jgi:ribose 5-phosphate isomerase B|nr:ribose 5-phosphate isomerase B [Desulfovibrio sp.]
MAQNIHIGCDHAALDLKNIIIRQLEERGLTVTDHGTYTPESCDYPDIAHDVAQAVEKENGTGILLCGTGIGMSMAANHHKGIRAALCTTELHAKFARRHNDANILCLGARMTGVELAKAIVEAFLTTGFEGGRHKRRIDKIPC